MHFFLIHRILLNCLLLGETSRRAGMRGRNPARDNRAEGRVKHPLPWRSRLARAALLFNSIERPSHALENPTVAPPLRLIPPTDSAQEPE